MKKRKTPRNGLLLTASAIILFRMPEVYREMIVLYFIRSPHRLRNLRYMLQNPFRQPALGMLLYGIVFLVFVFSLAGMLLQVKSRGPGKTKVERRTEKEIETIEKSFQTAYKSGKDRYLDQLDDFLRSGYLDQKSYNEMKKKYKNMNIPDGF